MKVTRLFSMCW